MKRYFVTIFLLNIISFNCFSQNEIESLEENDINESLNGYYSSKEKIIFDTFDCKSMDSLDVSFYYVVFYYKNKVIDISPIERGFEISELSNEHHISTGNIKIRFKKEVISNDQIFELIEKHNWKLFNGYLCKSFYVSDLKELPSNFSYKFKKLNL